MTTFPLNNFAGVMIADQRIWTNIGETLTMTSLGSPAVEEGDVLILGIAGEGFTDAGGGPNWGTPAGWNSIGDANGPAANDDRFKTYWKVATAADAAGTATYGVSLTEDPFGNKYVQALGYAFRGVEYYASTAIQVSAIGAGNPHTFDTLTTNLPPVSVTNVPGRSIAVQICASQNAGANPTNTWEHEWHMRPDTEEGWLHPLQMEDDALGEGSNPAAAMVISMVARSYDGNASEVIAEATGAVEAVITGGFSNPAFGQMITLELTEASQWYPWLVQTERHANKAITGSGTYSFTAPALTILDDQMVVQGHGTIAANLDLVVSGWDKIASSYSSGRGYTWAEKKQATAADATQGTSYILSNDDTGTSTVSLDVHVMRNALSITGATLTTGVGSPMALANGVIVGAEIDAFMNFIWWKDISATTWTSNEDYYQPMVEAWRWSTASGYQMGAFGVLDTATQTASYAFNNTGTLGERFDDWGYLGLVFEGAGVPAAAIPPQTYPANYERAPLPGFALSAIVGTAPDAFNLYGDGASGLMDSVLGDTPAKGYTPKISS